MKIEYEHSGKDHFAFGRLSVGDVFTRTELDGTNLLIKVGPDEAFDLKNDWVISFGQGVSCKKVSAKIVVQD